MSKERKMFQQQFFRPPCHLCCESRARHKKSNDFRHLGQIF